MPECPNIEYKSLPGEQVNKDTVKESSEITAYELFAENAAKKNSMIVNIVRIATRTCFNLIKVSPNITKINNRQNYKKTYNLQPVKTFNAFRTKAHSTFFEGSSIYFYAHKTFNTPPCHNPFSLFFPIKTKKMKKNDYFCNKQRQLIISR